MVLVFQLCCFYTSSQALMNQDHYAACFSSYIHFVLIVLTVVKREF